MYSLFRRTFFAFLLILVVLLLVLTGALVTGYNRSLSAWSDHRVRSIEQAVRSILAGRPAAEVPLPQDVPVFVYDSDGVLLASNRGLGRRRDAEHEERIPVRSAAGLVGYYSVGATVFRNDAANRVLAESLIRAAIAGALAAFAVAAMAAWVFARTLSNPAARVAEGIDRIAHGVPVTPIPVQGAEEIGRIARAANTLAQRLNSEQKLRTQWAQDVTHDLRTPIASIRAQLEAVLDGVYTADPPRVKATLEELARVESLIDDLDELMRLEAPETELNLSRFSTENFSSTLLRRFQRDIERKQIAVTVDTTLGTLVADEPLMYRAVSNVFANAIRHAPEGSPVTIAFQADNGGIRIIVHNNGPAIPASELPCLFDRLFRGEYARNSAGSGLGLTIARRIVMLHGGDITVTSTELDGTSVSITISDLSSRFTHSS